jgi:dihydrolipoamide dehydrogenase
MSGQTFDVVVIGGGPVGEVAAERAVRGGLKTALVEHERFGGECSYWACVPSKALLRPGNLLAAAKRIPGVVVGDALDPAQVFARRDWFTGKGDDSGQFEWARGAGIEPVRGHGVITGEREVTVDGDRVLTARHAVIVCTGSVPNTPKIPGLDTIRPWGSRDATSASVVPARLGILGGGVVGVEMAQAFQTLGSQVTLVEGGRRLLPKEEDYACDQVTEALASYGVDIRTGQKAERIEQAADGTVTVTTSDGGSAVGDKLLVSLGRDPATKDVGVETVGLEPGKAIHVDAHMRVPGHPWLYAIGDVNGRALFTHMGKYQARISVDHVLGHDHVLAHGADGPLSPRVIFTEPQVAAVGHTTKTAEQAGLIVDVHDTPTSANAGGSFYGRDAPGTTRWIVDRERRIVVGCTITGAEIADFLHAATIAIVGEVPIERLRHAVPSFPTRSEIWLQLAV